LETTGQHAVSGYRLFPFRGLRRRGDKSQEGAKRGSDIEECRPLSVGVLLYQEPTGGVRSSWLRRGRRHGNLTETFGSSDRTHLQQGTRLLTYSTAESGRTVLATAQNLLRGVVYIVSSVQAVELGAGSPSLSIFEHQAGLNLSDIQG
jgi:hypothetical protein